MVFIYVYFPKQLHFKTELIVPEINILKNHSSRERADGLWVEGNGWEWGVRGLCSNLGERNDAQTWVERIV